MTSPTSAAGRRRNRRGAITRMQVLDAALEQLASGRAEAVSVNLVAKRAGVTWGTVQYQFGDADGLWAAALEHIIDTAGSAVWGHPCTTSVTERVGEVIDLVWAALDSVYYTARTTLQSTLARDWAELQSNYPKTAQALERVDRMWTRQFTEFFGDLPVDAVQARRVCAYLPVALRGLHDESTRHADFDSADALAGLRDSVTAYLSAGSGQ